MTATKSLLLASFLATVLGAVGLGGCSCPSRVPVSLEPLNDWLLYHGRCAWRYPFSCPCCPYAGREVVEADPILPGDAEPSAPTTPTPAHSPPKP